MTDYLGIPIAQMPIQIGKTIERIIKFDVKLFIELGIYKGGLSQIMLLGKECFPGFDYLGLENDPPVIDPRLRNKAEVVIGDVFSPSIIAMIQSRIQTCQGAAMVFCDDGNKPKEMETYAPIIRVGDILQAHDYPGEVSAACISTFNQNHLYMQELDADKIETFKMPAWKRIA